MIVTQAVSRKAVHVMLAALFVAAWGCGRSGDHPDTTQVEPSALPETTPLPPVLSDTSSGSIVREAQKLYDYGLERPPIAVRDAAFKGPYVPDDSLPRMWIATAKLKGSTRPPHRIIARIRSERAYPPMGIDSGYNYIWRNSWDSTAAERWVTKIVAGNTRTKQHRLRRDPRRHEYTHGRSPLEPRLVRIKVHSVAIGACLDDPVCPSGHCGYY
jgi:hypothetical protein